MKQTAYHLQDEELDEYCLGHLANARCAYLEEHLLLCKTCCARLIETEGFLAAIRRAGRQWLKTGRVKHMVGRGAAAVG